MMPPVNPQASLTALALQRLATCSLAQVVSTSRAVLSEPRESDAPFESFPQGIAFLASDFQVEHQIFDIKPQLR